MGNKIFKFLPFLFLLVAPVVNIVDTNFNSKDTVVLAEEEYPRLNTADIYFDYWNVNVRPEPNSSICDIKKTLFDHLYREYQIMPYAQQNLLNTDVKYVDKAGARIKDTLVFLNNHFYPVSNSNNNKSLLTEDTTITIIIAIAIFGMTAISLFYVFKNKKIIQ